MEHLPCSIYGLVVLSYLGLQLLFAELEHRRHRRTASRPGDWPAVTVVLPTYNQPEESLRVCVESVADQDYPGEILLLVVDDGSREPPGRDGCGIGAFSGSRRKGELLCLPRNVGKRRAQRAAFDRTEGEYVVSLDDDTTLAPDALSRLVALMESDERVGAATGSIRVRNRISLFTRLLDLRYWAACHLERAAQSYFGVMVCCSGAIAIYRRDLIERLKEEYVRQRFLGRECTYGDDRHLTNLVLREGYDARFVPDAAALTSCPESVWPWLRQQRRWSKSYYRECWWSLRFVHRRNVYFGYNLLVGALLPFLLAYGLAAAGAHVAAGHWSTAGRYLATVVAMGWVRGACGLLMTRDPAFLLMPLYACLHLALVFPVRLIALFTLWDMRWGTR